MRRDTHLSYHCAEFAIQEPREERGGQYQLELHLLLAASAAGGKV